MKAYLPYALGVVKLGTNKKLVVTMDSQRKIMWSLEQLHSAREKGRPATKPKLWGLDVGD